MISISNQTEKMRSPAMAVRVLIAGADGAGAAAAPFGLSMFDAVKSSGHQNFPDRKSVV